MKTKFQCQVSDCARYARCKLTPMLVRQCGRKNPKLGDYDPVKEMRRENAAMRKALRRVKVNADDLIKLREMGVKL